MLIQTELQTNRWCHLTFYARPRVGDAIFHTGTLRSVLEGVVRADANCRSSKTLFSFQRMRKSVLWMLILWIIVYHPSNMAGITFPYCHGTPVSCDPYVQDRTELTILRRSLCYLNLSLRILWKDISTYGWIEIKCTVKLFHFTKRIVGKLATEGRKSTLSSASVVWVGLLTLLY